MAIHDNDDSVTWWLKPLVKPTREETLAAIDQVEARCCCWRKNTGTGEAMHNPALHWPNEQLTNQSSRSRPYGPLRLISLCYTTLPKVILSIPL